MLRVNTSHVIVHLILANQCNMPFQSVNTSHVIVHRKAPERLYLSQLSVNTSHVIVHLVSECTVSSAFEVSIHPMLLFIWK